jgi:hypothetical protein
MQDGGSSRKNRRNWQPVHDGDSIFFLVTLPVSFWTTSQWVETGHAHEMDENIWCSKGEQGIPNSRALTADFETTISANFVVASGGAKV